MQMDFFSAAKAPAPAVPVAPGLTLEEDKNPGYAIRTGINARGADVTAAFAVDFETAGEKLTKRMAAERYVAAPYGSSTATAAAAVIQKLRQMNGNSLNIAGNGIYTLAKEGWMQSHVNQWVYEVLQRVHAVIPLHHIRSGGQTGVDVAGLVAAVRMGVPATGLLPQGYLQRLATMRDVRRNPVELHAELLQMAEALVDDVTASYPKPPR